jgi:hypothetical protein
MADAVDQPPLKFIRPQLCRCWSRHRPPVQIGRTNSNMMAIASTRGSSDVTSACSRERASIGQIDTRRRQRRFPRLPPKLPMSTADRLRRVAFRRILEDGKLARRAHMEAMVHRLRFPPAVLLWLTGMVVFLGTETTAAQQSSETNAVERNISSARSARLVSACRNEAERQAAPTKGWHSLQWDNTEHPEITRSDGPRVDAQVSLAGWARSGMSWVSIKAHCAFERGRPAVVSLDLMLSGMGLDLSGITTVPQVPTQPEATLRSFSQSPPSTDPPETSGSSTIAPTLHETRPDLPPTIDKRQDFIHDHRFGIELRTPF